MDLFELAQHVDEMFLNSKGRRQKDKLDAIEEFDPRWKERVGEKSDDSFYRWEDMEPEY